MSPCYLVCIMRCISSRSLVTTPLRFDWMHGHQLETTSARLPCSQVWSWAYIWADGTCTLVPWAPPGSSLSTKHLPGICLFVHQGAWAGR